MQNVIFKMFYSVKNVKKRKNRDPKKTFYSQSFYISLLHIQIEVAEIVLIAAQLGQFQQLLKTCVILILSIFTNLVGSRNSEYPWIFTVLRTERNMACRFTKVSEDEIEEAFFHPSDLVNTKTTIPLRVGEERWIYTSTLRVSVYIHHYSPRLRGILVY